MVVAHIQHFQTAISHKGQEALDEETNVHGQRRDAVRGEH